MRCLAFVALWRLLHAVVGAKSKSVIEAYCEYLRLTVKVDRLACPSIDGWVGGGGGVPSLCLLCTHCHSFTLTSKGGGVVHPLSLIDAHHHQDAGARQLYSLHLKKVVEEHFELQQDEAMALASLQAAQQEMESIVAEARLAPLLAERVVDALTGVLLAAKLELVLREHGKLVDGVLHYWCASWRGLTAPFKGLLWLRHRCQHRSLCCSKAAARPRSTAGRATARPARPSSWFSRAWLSPLAR